MGGEQMEGSEDGVKGREKQEMKGKKRKRRTGRQRASGGMESG